MIRVALKETYISNDEQIKQREQQIEDRQNKLQSEQQANGNDVGMIVGPSTVQSYDVVKFYVQELDAGNTAVAAW